MERKRHIRGTRMNEFDGRIHRKFGTKVLVGLLSVCRVEEHTQVAIRFARPLEGEDREEVVLFGNELQDKHEYGQYMHRAVEELTYVCM